MTFSAITTVISAATNYDLTDLATVKTELSITQPTNDTWLGKAISQVSRAIAAYVKRVMVPEVVQDSFDFQSRHRGHSASGVAGLQLSRWPVLSVVSVVQTLTPTTLIEGTDFQTDALTGELIRLNSSGVATLWEAEPVTVIYMAGFGTANSEAHTVPAAPYQVTATPVFSCDQSVSYANGTKLTRVSSGPAAGQYSVVAGLYTFAAADTGQVLTFAYGAKVIPDDLIEICLRLVGARFSAKGRDPTLIQQETPGVGTQRYWFGGAPGQTGPFAPDIEHSLEPYCMPVMA